MASKELSQDIGELARTDAPVCVSVFLDCRDASVHRDAFSARFKNALRQLADQLPDPSRSEMLDALRTRESELKAKALQEPGLVVFQTPEEVRAYGLPFCVSDHVSVGQRFLLKSILTHLCSPEDFWILALSQHTVRLLRAGPDTVREVELGDFSTLNLGQLTVEQPHLNLHSGRNGEGVFHGQKREERREDQDLKRFLRKVAQAVAKAIEEDSGENSNAPIVLAGVHWLTSAFRVEGAHLPLSEQEISGNPERSSYRELANQAASVARNERESKESSIRRGAKDGPHLSGARSGVSDILLAANDGRIETLFVQRDARVLGSFDANQHSATVLSSPEESDWAGEAEDLLNRAAIDTFRNGGGVLELAEEDDDTALAILRY